MGRFIAVEGIDRTGKSTQVERLAVAARASGLSVAVTSYPLRTAPVTSPLIDRLLHRDLRLTNRDDSPGQAFASQLIFSLNRREGAAELRALIAGHDLTIVSRHALSGAAYAMAEGVSRTDVLRLQQDLEADLPAPELILMLDADPELLMARARAEKMDAIDADLALQRRVRGAYLALAQNNTAIERIDALGGADEVAARLHDALVRRGILAASKR
jgi:dTMP kinase